MRGPLLALLVAGCATSPHSPSGALAQRLRGLGTEPFWSVALDGDTLRYRTPERPEQRIRVTRRESADGLAFVGVLVGEPIRARISRKSCSDGMSDRTYPLTLTLEVGGSVLNGCAYPAGAER